MSSKEISNIDEQALQTRSNLSETQYGRASTMNSTNAKKHLMLTKKTSGIDTDEFERTSTMGAQDLFDISSAMRAVTPCSLAAPRTRNSLPSQHRSKSS